MRKSNKAFTLTELLVALGVIAILCAVLLPVIFNLLPNQNVVMAKRAFYTTQTIVAELINNEACYPDKTTAANVSEIRIGFDDAAGSPNCTNWTITTATDATKKFLTLFGDKLGLASTPSESTVFSTSDGMDWVFTSAAFSKSSTEGGSIKLTVDVNGSDDPNCGSSGNYSTEFKSGGSNCSGKTNLDRFQMKIYGNGRIEIVDDWAKDAVKVTKKSTDEE